MPPPPTFVPAMPHSSPHSSDEATHHDTPSTNFTAYSPETAYKNKSTNNAQPKFHLNVNVANGANKHGDDVFLNEPTPTSGRSQLSPTAATFTPGQYNSYYAAHNATASTASRASYLSNGSGQTVVGGGGVRIAGTPFISCGHYRSSDFESVGAIGEPTANVESLTTAYGRVRLDQPESVEPSLEEVNIAIGNFTSDETMKRGLMITGVGSNVSWISIAQAFTAARFPSQKGINATSLSNNGTFVMEFGDVRDAFRAAEDISYCRPEWAIIPITPKGYAEYVQQGVSTHFQQNIPPQIQTIDPAFVTDYESQVLVTVFFDGRTPARPAGPVLHLLQQALFACGTVKALHSLPADQGNIRDFRVEYYDTRSAEAALQSLNRSLVGDFIIAVERFTPDIAVPTPQGGPPREILSMTGRSTIPLDDITRQVNIGVNLQLGNPFNGGSMGPRNDINHNQVVIGRIQAGVDVRTTIMLRNIPNKIDQAMLKAILDETSFGCYDFMYLRIDFANNCNVGYAFINFTDALAIIPFALARAGQRWNRFNSDKVAEISYATIQGKDCLVQKFRNSSVMLEHPTFRPKLYTTGSGPDAGTEEKFPGPDNPSKMRRSVENAEHVGLFARTRQGPHGITAPKLFPKNWPAARGVFPPARARPNTFAAKPSPRAKNVNTQDDNDPFVGSAMPSSFNSSLFAPREGQIYRDQQRSRRSQFDRGTSLSESEAYYNQTRMRDPARSPPAYAPRPPYYNPTPSNEFPRPYTAQYPVRRPYYEEDGYYYNGRN